MFVVPLGTGRVGRHRPDPVLPVLLAAAVVARDACGEQEDETQARGPRRGGGAGRHKWGAQVGLAEGARDGEGREGGHGSRVPGQGYEGGGAPGAIAEDPDDHQQGHARPPATPHGLRVRAGHVPALDRPVRLDVRQLTGSCVGAQNTRVSRIMRDNARTETKDILLAHPRRLYAKCPCYVVLYMQSVRIMQCFICKVFLSCSALYAKCPYYLVLYMQSVLIM